MTTEADLIGKGYFPKEVQPTFTSATLASYASSAGTASLLPLLGGTWWTKHTKHNLARAGGFRRPLSIPNPGGYLRIANATASAWQTEIAPLFATMKMGASRPVASGGTRAIEALNPNARLESLRAENRRGARYLLHADVQNFYPSIYTHSIDWAIHGKTVAKATFASKTKSKTAGMTLDEAFRGAQEGQTVGIAIGPDASLIIAECIMARIEEILRNRLPNVSGYRYWDDFELAFTSLSDAEKGLAALEEALSTYELSLNARKTHLIELPEPLDEAGIYELSSWDLSPGKGQKRQLLGYFDEVYRRIAANRFENVASFAVARLRSETIAPWNWSLVQSNLLQLLVVEPSCARYVAEILGAASRSGMALDKDSFRKSTELLAIKHGPMGQGSEVAWALWISIANGITISDVTANVIVEMKDNLVALLALHAQDAGLFGTSLNTAYWQSLMTTDELRSENWLLSYEARIKGWLASSFTTDHIAADPFFDALRHGGVSFYDVSKLIITLPASVTMPSSGAPVRSMS